MSAKRERLAVVTGGIGGLGTEICIHLARSGRKVVAADLDARPERIDAFRESVSEFNGHIRFEPLNVADFDHCAEFAERVQQHHGAVDILVNAAGITRDTTLRKMDAKQWSDVIRVNLDGVFNLSRQFVDGMCERGFGRIVNISSVNGQTGQFGDRRAAGEQDREHGGPFHGLQSLRTGQQGHDGQHHHHHAEA